LCPWQTLSFKEPPAGHDKWQEEMTNNAAYSALAMSKGAVANNTPAPAGMADRVNDALAKSMRYDAAI